MSSVFAQIQLAVLIAQVVAGQSGTEYQGPTPVVAVAAYHERDSIMGGRFLLVDTLYADVEVVVTQGSDPSEWNYVYSIIHRPNSTGDIDYVAIGPLDIDPINRVSPPHWQLGPSRPGTVVWIPVELGLPPSGWIDDGVQTYPSTYAISPGDSLGGFGFTARGSFKPFSRVDIELRVWEPIPPVEEKWMPRCDYRGSGSTIGPGRPR